MSKMQIIYFFLRGRAEAIRTLLVEQGVEYEEQDVMPMEKWLNEWKPKMAFGQCPMLIDGDVELVQSNAILRYLARKYDLYGSTNQEAARVDMINDGVEDLRGAYTVLIYQNYVWDDQLSKEAASWIKRCQFEHEKKGRGENLAFDSNPKKDEELINSSMKAWYDEIKDYNYAAKRCGRSCHYTQVVWAKTRKVGCAIEKCNYLYAFGRPIKNAWYLACYYDPMGNDVSEYPFTKGPACSQCLQKQTCENGLCTGEGVEVCEDLDEDCDFWSTSGECQKNPKFMLKKCRKSCGVCKGGK